MGETEKKPKIEGRKSSWKPRNTGGSRAKVLIKFKAPTPGHEDDIFTCGQASDAANFEEVCKKLARYCAVNFKNGGTMVRKAIEEKIPFETIYRIKLPDGNIKWKHSATTQRGFVSDWKGWGSDISEINTLTSSQSRQNTFLKSLLKNTI